MWDNPRDEVLVQHAPIADLAEDAAADGWLTAAEWRELERYRDSRRRTAWLCGRLLGKRLVIEAIGMTWGRFPTCPSASHDAGPGRSETCPTEIEILSRDARGRAVRPVVRARGVELECSLSISHTDRLVIAGLANGERRVGVDLVPVRDVNPAALRLWFTAREVELLRESSPAASEQPGCWACAWAIKEAAYKALNDGEPFAPQRIEIVRARAGEFAILYDGIEPHVDCRVETWEIGDHVAALVTLSSLRRFAATRQAVDERLATSIPT